jgi:exosortase A-associated hydrolase 1
MKGRRAVPEYVEHAFLIGAGPAALPGVLSVPIAGEPILGCVIIPGGFQYRAGAHRQFVLLARRLAADGYAALRFDRAGIGDAPGERASFDAVAGEIGAAVAALRRACPSLRGVLLCGLCDGASAALLYWEQTRDPGIAGMALLNPWARNEVLEARALVKHYYLRRLGQKDFWRKLVSGRVAGLRAARELAGNLAGAAQATGQGAGQAGAAPWQSRMASALREFPGALLLLLSEHDRTAHEFAEWLRSDPALRGAGQRPGVTRREVADADHTFSSAALRAAAEQAVLDWLRCLDQTERGRAS